MNKISIKELQERCLSRGLKTYGSKLIKADLAFGFLPLFGLASIGTFL